MQTETSIVVFVGSQTTGVCWRCDGRIPFQRVPCVGENINIDPDREWATIENVVWNVDGSAELHIYYERNGFDPGSPMQKEAEYFVNRLAACRYRVVRGWNGCLSD